MKRSQIDTEKYKKYRNFQTLKAFMLFFRIFVHWNVGKGQQRKNVLCSMLREEKYQFFKRKVPGIDIKKDKYSNVFRFSIFVIQYLSKNR